MSEVTRWLVIIHTLHVHKFQGDQLESEGEGTGGTSSVQVESLYHLERWQAGEEVISLPDTREPSQGIYVCGQDPAE